MLYNHRDNDKTCLNHWLKERKELCVWTKKNEHSGKGAACEFRMSGLAESLGKLNILNLPNANFLRWCLTEWCYDETHCTGTTGPPFLFPPPSAFVYLLFPNPCLSVASNYPHALNLHIHFNLCVHHQHLRILNSIWHCWWWGNVCYL